MNAYSIKEREQLWHRQYRSKTSKWTSKQALRKLFGKMVLQATESTLNSLMKTPLSRNLRACRWLWRTFSAQVLGIKSKTFPRSCRTASFVRRAISGRLSLSEKSWAKRNAIMRSTHRRSRGNQENSFTSHASQVGPASDSLSKPSRTIARISGTSK